MQHGHAQQTCPMIWHTVHDDLHSLRAIAPPWQPAALTCQALFSDQPSQTPFPQSQWLQHGQAGAYMCCKGLWSASWKYTLFSRHHCDKALAHVCTLMWAAMGLTTLHLPPGCSAA